MTNRKKKKVRKDKQMFMILRDRKGWEKRIRVDHFPRCYKMPHYSEICPQPADNASLNELPQLKSVNFEYYRSREDENFKYGIYVQV